MAVRLDPFQNIVNVGWGGGTIVFLIQDRSDLFPLAEGTNTIIACGGIDLSAGGGLEGPPARLFDIEKGAKKFVGSFLEGEDFAALFMTDGEPIQFDFRSVSSQNNPGQADLFFRIYNFPFQEFQLDDPFVFESEIFPAPTSPSHSDYAPSAKLTVPRDDAGTAILWEAAEWAVP